MDLMAELARAFHEAWSTWEAQSKIEGPRRRLEGEKINRSLPNLRKSSRNTTTMMIKPLLIKGRPSTITSSLATATLESTILQKEFKFNPSNLGRKYNGTINLFDYTANIQTDMHPQGVMNKCIYYAFAITLENRHVFGITSFSQAQSKNSTNSNRYLLNSS